MHRDQGVAMSCERAVLQIGTCSVPCTCQSSCTAVYFGQLRVDLEVPGSPRSALDFVHGMHFTLALHMICTQL